MNWLAPSIDIWNARYGKGTANAGMMGKALKPLKDHYTPEQIAAHLNLYLEKTPAQYLNLYRFAMTFGEYAPVEPTKQDPVVDEFGCLTASAENATKPRRS